MLGKPKIDDVHKILDARIDRISTLADGLFRDIKAFYNAGRLRFGDSIIIKNKMDMFASRLDALKTDPYRYDKLGKRNNVIADDVDAPLPKNLADLPKDVGMKVIFLSLMAYFDVGYSNGGIDFDQSLSVVARKNEALDLLISGQ